jgi:putative transposase
MERALEEDAASNGSRVLKRLHYPLDMVLTCMRWSVAYPLSLRTMLAPCTLVSVHGMRHSTTHGLLGDYR